MSSPASPSISLTAAERTRREGSHCPLPRALLPCLQSCFSTFLPSLLRFKFSTDSRMHFKSLTLERGPTHADPLTQVPPRDTPSPGATKPVPRVRLGSEILLTPTPPAFYSPTLGSVPKPFLPGKPIRLVRYQSTSPQNLITCPQASKMTP